MKKCFRKLLSVITVIFLLASMSVSSFAVSGATVTLDGDVSYTSSGELEKLAWLNNVDVYELREAIKNGPDEDGRYSPFSKLAPLNNDITLVP